MNLKKTAVWVSAVWIVLQSVMVALCWGAPQYSDSAAYVRCAYACFEQGAWYPTPAQIAGESYVFNPGYINYLIVALHVFGSLNPLPIVNVLMNAAVAYFVFRIASALFDRRTGYITVVLYCALISNLLSPVVILSDLLYLFLLTSALVLVRDRWWWLLSAGVLLGLSNYVRPVSLIFVVAVLLYMLARRFRVWSYVWLACGVAAAVGGIAMFNRTVNGTYMYAASTGGCNLIMGANDDADGSYTSAPFEEGGIGYIAPGSRMDTAQKDAFWKRQAVGWIKEHPGRYISLMPVKLVRLWLGDDYFRNVFDPDLGKGKDPAARMAEIVLLSLTYYMVLLLALAGLVGLGWRGLLSVKGLPLLPVLACCAMHMLMYGGMRYHYPFMPCVVMYAAYAAGRLLERRRLRTKRPTAVLPLKNDSDA